jgi:hypothetical protein
MVLAPLVPVYVLFSVLEQVWVADAVVELVFEFEAVAAVVYGLVFVLEQLVPVQILVP